MKITEKDRQGMLGSTEEKCLSQDMLDTWIWNWNPSQTEDREGNKQVSLPDKKRHKIIANWIKLDRHRLCLLFLGDMEKLVRAQWVIG